MRARPRTTRVPVPWEEGESDSQRAAQTSSVGETHTAVEAAALPLTSTSCVSVTRQAQDVKSARYGVSSEVLTMLGVHPGRSRISAAHSPRPGISIIGPGRLGSDPIRADDCF